MDKCYSFRTCAIAFFLHLPPEKKIDNFGAMTLACAREREKDHRLRGNATDPPASNYPRAERG